MPVTGQAARAVHLPDATFEYISPEWTYLAQEAQQAGSVLTKHAWTDLPWKWPGADEMEPSRELCPGQFVTWEQWLRATGFDAKDPYWQAKFGKTPWGTR